MVCQIGRSHQPTSLSTRLYLQYGQFWLRCGRYTGHTHAICDRERGGPQESLKPAEEKGEWVTTIERVSANGTALPPLVIFRALTQWQNSWVPEIPLIQDGSGPTLPRAGSVMPVDLSDSLMTCSTPLH